MMIHPYNVEIWLDPWEDGSPCFIARYPSMPGVLAQGDTFEECLASLREALDLTLDALTKRGVEVPPPEPGFIVHLPCEPAL